MEKFFHLKENGTTVSTEILAGLTTFFAMAYIIVVNPQILSQTGMPWGGVFLATIIAAIIGTLVMGLFANVPYAQAAGMGLNAFFTYTVCFGLGFSWQQTMCMVFLCGLINILITVTKIRKMIILAIPESLQHAIGGGIGLFVAYVGMLNVGLIKFTPGDPKAAAKGGAVAATPGLANFNDKVLWVFLIGLVLAIVFTVMKVKGGMLLAIAITTVIGIPFGVTTWSNSQSISETFSQLPQTFGAIFSAEGFPALFSDPTKLPLVIVTIFAFSMSDTFDTLGTFIGTGRRGADWLEKICAEHHIAHKPGTVDIGVRVECRNEVMEKVNKVLYESKLIGYPKPWKNKVRTFCQNPGGFVAQENYDNDLAVVNGHSFKEKKSENTNLAILVSHNFTEPFNQPIAYAQKVGELTNMLGAGHIMVQRYGDILDGKRTWQKELAQSNVKPTLKDAVAGDITAAMPYRAMTNIIEFIKMLDMVVPGFAANETLLYSPELKFYSNKVKMDADLDTNIKGLHCLGDSSGWTRGLMMASVMGVLMGRKLAEKEGC